MPACSMMSLGRIDGESIMGWHDMGVFDGGFDDPCGQRRVLSGVITEMRGGVLTRDICRMVDVYKKQRGESRLVK